MSNQETIQETENPVQPQPEAVSPAEAPTAEVPAESPAAGTKVENKQEQQAPAANPETLNKLKDIHSKGESIEVDVISRVRGGLRVSFEDYPVFLPASQFSMSRNPSAEDLDAAVNSKMKVRIHEIKEEGSAASVVASRKALIEEDALGRLKVGDRISGPVTSVTTFGVFVDLGGLEGLIHVSKLSNSRVEDPKDFAKKGDTLEAVITDINHSTKKIALSRKEIEPSPWDTATEKFPVDSVQKGIVRRLTDFGAYVELTPGIDGLCRISEFSWTKRIARPSDVLQTGSEYEFKVVSVTPEKKQLALSLKRLTENPWNALTDKFSVGTVFPGVVKTVNEKGYLVGINDEIDGFLPKSKIRGYEGELKENDPIEVKVLELDREKESLILAYAGFAENQEGARPERGERRERQPRDRDRGERRDDPNVKMHANNGNLSFAELLGENVFDKLK